MTIVPWRTPGKQPINTYINNLLTPINNLLTPITSFRGGLQSPVSQVDVDKEMNSDMINICSCVRNT